MQAKGCRIPRELAVGQILVIPGHSFAMASEAGLADQWIPPEPIASSRGRSNPGSSLHPSGYQRRNADGVDIAAPAGTPVNAADDGVVIYCGRLRGYGTS